MLSRSIDLVRSQLWRIGEVKLLGGGTMKVLKTMRGMRVSRIKSVCITSLMTVMFGGAVVGQEAPPGFAGAWATKLDNHIFLVVMLEAVPGSTGHFTGTLSRPQHFIRRTASRFPPLQARRCRKRLCVAASAGIVSRSLLRVLKTKVTKPIFSCVRQRRGEER